LNKPLNKIQRLSNWNKVPLTKSQKLNAANDVMIILQIYEKLKVMPDLTIPPPINYITSG